MSQRRARPHGGGRKPRTPQTGDKSGTLTVTEIAGLTASLNRRYQAKFEMSAAGYLNARAEKGISPDGTPSYILSDFLFRDYGMSVSWLAPQPKGYLLTRKGVIRPWTLVAFHGLGDTRDGLTLKRHRGLVSAPTDKYGHDPIRWNIGIRYLTAWGVHPGHAGVHFCISRKGDYLSSVDLNDTAYATAGARAFGNYGFNAASIGFELEAHLARKYPDGTVTSRVYRQPYPDRQLLCLAVALRKINSWRPVINFTYLATGQEVIAARNAKSGGMFQHFTIAYPSRTDPGAQFNIPPGQKASFGSPMWNGEGGPNVGSSRGNGPVMRSGWDQLEEIYNKLRGVNPATEVFQKPVTPTALALAKATSLIARSSNPGQSAALRRGRNAVAALSRSEGMQGQTRREMYSRAAANNASLAGLLAKAGNTAGIIAQRFDLSGIRGVAGAELYDYETGLWKKSDETS